jgi:hypothetical protein
MFRAFIPGECFALSFPANVSRFPSRRMFRAFCADHWFAACWLSQREIDVNLSVGSSCAWRVGRKREGAQASYQMASTERSAAATAAEELEQKKREVEDRLAYLSSFLCSTGICAQPQLRDHVGGSRGTVRADWPREALQHRDGQWRLQRIRFCEVVSALLLSPTSIHPMTNVAQCARAGRGDRFA